MNEKKAAALMESDFSSVSILMTCYKVIGDVAKTRLAAQRPLARAEKITTQEPDNGLALGYVVMSLCTLGQAERAKDLAKRAMLLEPDNLTMRYNFGCGFTALGEFDAALDLLGPVFERDAAETAPPLRRGRRLRLESRPSHRARPPSPTPTCPFSRSSSNPRRRSRPTRRNSPSTWP